MRLKLDLSDYVLLIGGQVLRFLVYAMMVAPAVIVIAASFTPTETLEFPPKGFSLSWYENAWSSPQFMSALWVSVKLACVATFGAVVIGFTAAFVIDRFSFLGKRAFQAVLLSPVIVPMVVLGLALVQFFSIAGIASAFTKLLIGHVLITLPYVVRTLLAGFSMFNKTYEEAALNLRASPLRTLLRVTVPILKPNIIAAAVFAFVTSFGNVTLSVFLADANTVTLPTQIFTFVESSYDPTVAAVSGIVILLTLAVILTIDKVIGVSQLVSR